MSNTIFKKVSIEAFGGINPDSPITIVFPETNTGVTVMVGDEATNKTSTMQALEALLGGVFNDNYVNAKSKSIRGETEFEVNGVQYRTRITKTQFRLEQYMNVAGKDKWQATGEDKSLIRTLLPYATSPEVLTDKSGEEQLLWIKKISGISTDDTELSAKHKVKYQERTLVNRDVKNLETQLLESGGYVREAKTVNPTEEYQQQMEKTLNFQLEEIRVVQAQELQTLLDTEKKVIGVKATYDNFDANIEAENKSIKELLDRIEQHKAKIIEIEEKKVKGKEYLDKYADLPTQIEALNKELKETDEAIASKQKIVATNKVYKDYNTKFSEAIALTTELDQIEADRLAIAKSLTPDIEGFEVSLGSIEKPKGLFLNGINIATLSESERYALCIKIWQHYKIKVVFIENISSLGSSAMEVIKLFTESGGTVFATSMRRGQNKISVSFNLNEEIKDTTNDTEEED